MPWREYSVLDQRLEFVRLAEHEGTNFSALCRSFGFATKTGYVWRKRYAADGLAGLQDGSRRPHASPRMTPPEMVAAITMLAQQHPTWGGRKLHHRLRTMGHTDVPAASTITAILSREGLTLDRAPGTHPVRRFEAASPNDRWQLDFMGWRPLRRGTVHPLTLLDDHSRYALLLEGQANEQRPTVEIALTACFRRYGLPWTILADNGPPWGSSWPKTRTKLEVWLMRLGIAVYHGRPAHPRTQGKLEPFHRTVAADVFAGRSFADLTAVQQAFDRFRTVYNHDRPHEAVGDRPPDTRYRRSPRAFPATLPEIVYADDATRRIVTPKGIIQFQGYRVYVGEAFADLPVGLVATATEGLVRLQFCSHHLRTIDLRDLEKR